MNPAEEVAGLTPPRTADDELDRLRRIEGRALALARRWRERYPAHARALFDAVEAEEVERGRR